jgi:alpha,alpha-trehalose phosphorylase
MAAEVGQLQLAYDYLSESVLTDLYDLAYNARDGVHIASLAGSWMALVMGFGGMRIHAKALSCSPRLPKQIQRLAFRLLFHGSTLQIEVKTTQVTYQLLHGAALTVKHYGEEITLAVGETVTRSIDMREAESEPTQPLGRPPIMRQIHHANLTSN